MPREFTVSDFILSDKFKNQLSKQPSTNATRCSGYFERRDNQAEPTILPARQGINETVTADQIVNEVSSIDNISAFVDMIKTQRHYEYGLKTIIIRERLEN